MDREQMKQRSLPSELSSCAEVCPITAKAGRTVLEEADESLYWLELIVETRIMRPELLRALMAEANERVAIFVSSLNTAKR